ncbi:MAG: ABC transporter ATP-binding protein [Alphaproteobacteria bacterium]|nr:ABC transporter ATP-binding protein [Alphaproteobacteria bacterium]
MSAAAVSLEVCEASVFYGAHQVLDRVSLSAAGGEFIALLGASGCGKTTLLRAICGFTALGSGAIVVGGRDVTRLSPDKRNIAMVFQSYALWPHMTVAQNIGYGLKLRHAGRAEITARINELLAMLQLDGLAARKVTALSGGQRQRVALGRALAVNPQILLLDEPLSNLDARIREDVRHEIKTLQRRLGITTVHVTHDRQEAMVMADRIAILDAGRVAQIGTPEEIYNRPASPFVASFMGASNVLPLRCGGDGKDVAIDDVGLSNGFTVNPSLLPAGTLRACGGEAPVKAHFRSEDARLCSPDEAIDGCLVLRGEIVQCSYPGGFYRYAVQVGTRQQYLVDDPRRLAVGEAIGIALPLKALHFYPANSAAKTQHE